MKRFIISLLTIVALGSINVAENNCFAQESTMLNNYYSKVCENGKCGIYAAFDREMITPMQYDDIVLINETGFCKVKMNGKWGIYSLDFRREASYVKYDDIASIQMNGNKCLKVAQNGKWAILDTFTGRELTTFKYDKVEPLWQDYFKVYVGNQCGLVQIQKMGMVSVKEVVPVAFSDVQTFYSSTEFKIVQNGRSGVYSTRLNKIVVEPNYDDVKEPRYDSVNTLSNGVWSVVRW